MDIFHQPARTETDGTLRLPLLPIFAAYTIGLYFGHFDLPFTSLGLIFFLLIFLALWALFVIMKRTLLGTWVGFALFFFLGIYSIHIYLHPEHPTSHISDFIGFNRITLEGILDRPPQATQGRTQLLIRSEKVILANRHHPCRRGSSSLCQGEPCTVSSGGSPPFFVQALLPSWISKSRRILL